MSKAYDPVVWRFLDAIMEKMGFHAKWRSWEWERECVSSVQFSLLVDGVPQADFKPELEITSGRTVISLLIFALFGGSKHTYLECNSEWCHQWNSNFSKNYRIK